MYRDVLIIGKLAGLLKVDREAQARRQ